MNLEERIREHMIMIVDRLIEEHNISDVTDKEVFVDVDGIANSYILYKRTHNSDIHMRFDSNKLGGGKNNPVLDMELGSDDLAVFERVYLAIVYDYDGDRYGFKIIDEDYKKYKVDQLF